MIYFKTHAYNKNIFYFHRTSGEETTRLTCMMGGTWFPQILGNPHDLSRDAVEQMAVEGVKEQLGISSDPVRVDSMICHKCIPTYRLAS